MESQILKENVGRKNVKILHFSLEKFSLKNSLSRLAGGAGTSAGAGREAGAGLYLSTTTTQVVARVALRSDDIPLGEQTVAQVSLVILLTFLLIM